MEFNTINKSTRETYGNLNTPDGGIIGRIVDKVLSLVGLTFNLTTNNVELTGGPVLVPASQTVTAAGGVTVTAGIMRLIGSGGPITVTANPQIVAGTEGQVVILTGSSDTNTVTLVDGNGVHLHGGDMELGDHDSITLAYDSDNAQWEEVTRNSTASEKSFGFRSKSGGSGTQYAGGYYEHSGSANDFSAGPSFGTANAAKGAHFFLVLGAITVDELTLTVTGTSITDNAVRVTSDTENIVIPNGTPADSYYETSKKWLGTVVITVASGTAKTCDFGYCKYWDNQNNDFRVLGVDVTWLGGANDSTPDIILRHHNGTAGNTDWTYTGSGATPPTPIASMATDYVTEIQVRNGEDGAWKRTNLNTTVMGNESEGTIIELVTTANRAFEGGNFILRIRPD